MGSLPGSLLVLDLAIARKDPLSPGLVELESDIMRTLSDARRSAADESASKIAA